MNYVLNRKVKLGVRATRGHGNVHFVTREDSSGGALVIDQSASMLIEAMQRDPSYKPSASEFEVLERLATEGVVSRTDATQRDPQFSADNLQFWVQTSDRCNLACTYCYL